MRSCLCTGLTSTGAALGVGIGAEGVGAFAESAELPAAGLPALPGAALSVILGS